MNSSARSSIPCIRGEANASDSHISSDVEDPPLLVVPSSPQSFAVGGFCFKCPTNSHEGSLKSLSIYTGAGFLWNPQIKLLTVPNLLWRKRLVTRNLGGALVTVRDKSRSNISEDNVCVIGVARYE
ncbi:hypothetical protein CR513_58596, partial [Mucuna pruriens]